MKIFVVLRESTERLISVYLSMDDANDLVRILKDNPNLKDENYIVHETYAT